MTAGFTVRAPHARPASAVRRVVRRARWETLLLARNGEQLLLTIVLPILILIVLTTTSFIDLGVADDQRINAVMPGVLGLAVLSTAFTAQAISVGFDRRYGVLRHLGAGPLGRVGLLVARTIAVCVIVVVQVLVLSAIGLALGWEPQGNPVYVLGLLTLAVVAFTALALAMAGTLRAEATLALANLVYVVLVIAGGLFIDLGATDGGWNAVAMWLPTGALADGLRDVLIHGQAPAWASVAVLAAWAAGAGAVAARWFKWD